MRAKSKYQILESVIQGKIKKISAIQVESDRKKDRPAL